MDHSYDITITVTTNPTGELDCELDINESQWIKEKSNGEGRTEAIGLMLSWIENAGINVSKSSKTVCLAHPVWIKYSLTNNEIDGINFELKKSKQIEKLSLGEQACLSKLCLDELQRIESLFLNEPF